MATSGEETTLGELVDFRSGGTPSKASPDFWTGEIPWVSAKDMKSFRLSDSQDHISEGGLKAGSRLAPAGSVLLLTRGMTLLHDVPICVVDRPMAFNQDVKALEAKPGLDPAFLPYLLLGRKHELLSSVDLAGHGTGRLNTDSLKALKVELPPLEEQRRITHILGTLDDKIELNDGMNETLEEMARALFKSWFVDFDPVRAKAEGRDTGLPKHLAELFPDRLVDSELGEIPEGWSVRRVEDIAEKVAMGPFGSNIKVETFGTHGVPVISGQHLRGITLEDSSFNFVTAEHAERLAGANVQRGDIVFTHAGSIGQAAYIPESSRYEKYVISQRQFYMRCDPAAVTPEFIALYFNSREGRHRLLANTSSSGVPSIARPVSYLRTIPITVPPLRVLRSFNEIARPLLGAQQAQKGANQTLAQARDALLKELIY